MWQGSPRRGCWGLAIRPGQVQQVVCVGDLSLQVAGPEGPQTGPHRRRDFAQCPIASPTSHTTKTEVLIAAAPLSLLPAHAKLRRDGYWGQTRPTGTA